MQRYDHKLNYIGTGEYVSDMEPSDSGEFYLASDVDALIAELEKALQAAVEDMQSHGILRPTHPAVLALRQSS